MGCACKNKEGVSAKHGIGLWLPANMFESIGQFFMNIFIGILVSIIIIIVTPVMIIYFFIHIIMGNPLKINISKIISVINKLKR